MTTKLGATGTYPDGSFGPHDEGSIQLAVAHDSKGNVHIDFGKDLSWLAMPSAQAINFARLILRHAGAKKVEIEL
ncbi:MAG TPA: hypothetical protein VEU47_11080 [Candidatus Cybelea sp.]|nr:hypothetical protein [Candidatus Cybelea sp.]